LSYAYGKYIYLKNILISKIITPIKNE